MINKFTITGIAAINQQNILGIDGDMPWGRIKSDLSFFKNQTLGKVLICGGNTYRSLPPAALKGRQFFVISRDIPNDVPDNVKFINTILCPSFIIEHVNEYVQSGELMVIGGGLIYKVFEQQYDKFFLTKIDGPEYETAGRHVTYFDTDLQPRSDHLNWTTKTIDQVEEVNDQGTFKITIQEMS